MERNEADCNLRHPQPTIVAQHRTETGEVAEELGGKVKSSKRGIMAVLQEFVPKAVGPTTIRAQNGHSQGHLYYRGKESTGQHL